MGQIPPSQVGIDNDRLLSTVRIMDTLSSMDARDAESARQDRELQLREENLRLQTAEAKRMESQRQYAVWKDTAAAEHSNMAISAASEVNIQDEDAAARLQTILGGFIYADDTTKRVVASQLEQARGIQAKVQQAQIDFGLDPKSVMVPSTTNPHVKQVDLGLLNSKTIEAQRGITSFVSSLDGDSATAFSRLVSDRGFSQVQAVDSIKGHLAAKNVFTTAAQIGGITAKEIQDAQDASRQIISSDWQQNAAPAGSGGGNLLASSRVSFYDPKHPAVVALSKKVTALQQAQWEAQRAAANAEDRSKGAEAVRKAIELMQPGEQRDAAAAHLAALGIFNSAAGIAAETGAKSPGLADPKRVAAASDAADTEAKRLVKQMGDVADAAPPLVLPAAPGAQAPSQAESLFTTLSKTSRTNP